MQDILGLDTHARMNTPGTIEGNWRWRMDWSQLSDEKKSSFRQLVTESGRLHA
jgi:4-alpha-glucanotransferase